MRGLGFEGFRVFSFLKPDYPTHSLQCSLTTPRAWRPVCCAAQDCGSQRAVCVTCARTCPHQRTHSMPSHPTPLCAVGAWPAGPAAGPAAASSSAAAAAAGGVCRNDAGKHVLIFPCRAWPACPKHTCPAFPSHTWPACTLAPAPSGEQPAGLPGAAAGACCVHLSLPTTTTTTHRHTHRHCGTCTLHTAHCTHGLPPHTDTHRHHGACTHRLPPQKNNCLR